MASTMRSIIPHLSIILSAHTCLKAADGTKLENMKISVPKRSAMDNIHPSIDGVETRNHATSKGLIDIVLRNRPSWLKSRFVPDQQAEENAPTPVKTRRGC